MYQDEVLTHEKILESYDLIKSYYPYPLNEYVVDRNTNYKEIFCLSPKDECDCVIHIYSIDNELIHNILDECCSYDEEICTYSLVSVLTVDGKKIKQLSKNVNVNLEKLFFKLQQNDYMDEYAKQKKMYQLNLDELLKIKYFF